MFKIDSIIKENTCFYRLLLFYILSIGIGANNDISDDYSSYAFYIFFGVRDKILSFSIIVGTDYDIEVKIQFG